MPRIAVIVDADCEFGRDVLRGVAKWMRQHQSWHVMVHDGRADGRLEAWIAAGSVSGVITQRDPASLPARVRWRGLPTVRFGHDDRHGGLPGIYVDDHGIGAAAADHLAEHGLRHLAFFGRASAACRRRREGFQARATDLGCQVVEHEVRPTGKFTGLAAWLEKLPKPAGVMAADDGLAARVLEACRLAGFSVPDKVAAVGVGNDDLLCNLAVPTLSSVIEGAGRVGAMAAETLAAAMAGDTAALRKRILVPPAGIEMRCSTDALLTHDPDLREVLAIIRRRACEGLTIEELAEGGPLARRTLERRFQKELGRSIRDEILRVRIDAARRMLAESDERLTAIAVRAGFADVASFCHRFKQVTGQRPGEYRGLFRSAADREVRAS